MKASRTRGITAGVAALVEATTGHRSGRRRRKQHSSVPDAVTAALGRLRPGDHRQSRASKLPRIIEGVGTLVGAAAAVAEISAQLRNHEDGGGHQQPSKAGSGSGGASGTSRARSSSRGGGRKSGSTGPSRSAQRTGATSRPSAPAGHRNGGTASRAANRNGASTKRAPSRAGNGPSRTASKPRNASRKASTGR